MVDSYLITLLRYKFSAVKTYHTLTIDEAEEKLKVRGGLKQSDRWLMHKKMTDIKGEPGIKEEEFGAGISVPALRVTDNMDTSGRIRKGARPRDDLAEELDFEEDFQDGKSLCNIR